MSAASSPRPILSSSIETLGECELPPTPSSPHIRSVSCSPSPDGEETTSGVLGSRILRGRLMQQASESVSLEPLPGEEFAPYFVLEEHAKSITSRWVRFTQRPFRFVHRVGPSRYDGVWIVLVASSRVEHLRGLGLQFEPASETELCHAISPSDGEIRVHGIVEATRKSQSRFAENAADCVSEGAAQLYWDALGSCLPLRRLLLKMLWNFLMRDIKTAPAEVKRRFFRFSSFLGRCVLDAIHSKSTEPADELLQRTPEAWMAIFTQLYLERTATSRVLALGEADTKRDFNALALLRGTLVAAGGKANLAQCTIDLNTSADDNLVLISEVLRIDLEPWPVFFGYSGALDDHEALLKLKGFGWDEMDMVMNQGIFDFVPVGYPSNVHKVLPTNLINKLPIGMMREAGTKSYRISRQIWWLRNPDYSPLLLIICGTISQDYDKSRLKMWMSSEEGQREEAQTLQNLRESKAWERTCVYYAELVCFEWARQVPASAHGSLKDFILRLAGVNVKSRAMEYMACVCRYFALCNPGTVSSSALSLLDSVLTVVAPGARSWRPRSVKDFTAIRYLELRIGNAHGDACKGLQPELSDTAELSHCLRLGEEDEDNHWDIVENMTAIEL